MMAACRFEVHHHIPRCLLGFYDRFAEDEFDGEGLQAWFEWEEEAFRYGVDPDVSREELQFLIEASASPVSRAAHRAHHSLGGDFARWGRRGGLRTLALYGRGWFVLLAGRRWEDHRRATGRVLCASVQGAVLRWPPRSSPSDTWLRIPESTNRSLLRFRARLTGGAAELELALTEGLRTQGALTGTPKSELLEVR
jgi:hypothetical protein